MTHRFYDKAAESFAKRMFDDANRLVWKVKTCRDPFGSGETNYFTLLTQISVIIIRSVLYITSLFEKD